MGPLALAVAVIGIITSTGHAEEPEPSFAPPRVVIQGLADPVSSTSTRAPLITPDQRPVENPAETPAETPAAVPAQAPLPSKQTQVRTTARLIQAAAEPKAPIASDPRQLRKITTIRPFQDYSPLGQPAVNRKPQELKLEGGEFPERLFESQVYRWKPSDLHHFPLYFEDPPLERYGHTHHELLQPFISAHRFGTQLIGLPYQMAIDPVLKKTYALGWYRPGEPAPMLLYQVPWNFEAAAVEAGVLTGLFFLVP